jgi:hypothetical protein
MKELDELEPQQYQNLYWEESVPVKDVRKSALRKFVYMATVICILFVLIGLFVKFSDQVELPFVLKSGQPEEIYRFPNAVYVVKKYVDAGNQVSKGQALLKITSPEIVAMINSYEEAEQKLLNFQLQKKLSVKKQKEIIGIEIGQNKNRVVEIQNELSSLNNTWQSNKARLQYEYENAQKKYNASKMLYDEKVISTFSFLEVEKEMIAAESALANASQNYDREKNRLIALSANYRMNSNSSNTEMNKLTIDTKYDSISLNNDFALAKDKIKNSFGDFEISNGAITLLAHEQSTVSYIFDGEKEVAPGSILLKVMYSNSPMYASISCPPSLIGKIKKNQRAALKIASFPFYEWGVAKGYISNVSLTPDEKGNFSVKIIMDDFGKLANLTQIGMNGNASIILEEKTFYDYFFRRVKKTYYNATLAN